MNTDDNCPYCGSKPPDMRRGGATNWGWQCGTNTCVPPVRSLLCREREEHNKTKEELVNAKEFANSRIHLTDELTRQNVQLLNEVEQARQKAEEENQCLHNLIQKFCKSVSKAKILDDLREEYSEILEKLKK